MRYRLRTLVLFLAIGPAILAAFWLVAEFIFFPDMELPVNAEFHEQFEEERRTKEIEKMQREIEKMRRDAGINT